MLREIFGRHSVIITVEENSIIGGFGDAVCAKALEEKYSGRVIKLGLPDTFLEHGNREILLESLGLDAAGIFRTANDALKISQ
jgi:1-deoxy-D-xylulose-5-phosphate synthase